MARLAYSGVAITAGSGRLNSGMGGSVLMKNGNVRNYITPINPQSENQQALRSKFAAITTAWLSLSDTRRDAWNSAASSGNFGFQDPFTGTTKNYSGKALFQSRAMFVLQGIATINYVVQDLVPANYEIQSNTVVSLVADDSANTLALTLAGDTSGGTTIYFLYASAPQSPGTSRARSYRMVGWVAGEEINAMGPSYNKFFGSLTGQAGNKIFWKLVAVTHSGGNTALMDGGVITVDA